jgi:hypothetical protein
MDKDLTGHLFFQSVNSGFFLQGIRLDVAISD